MQSAMESDIARIRSNVSDSREFEIIIRTDDCEHSVMVSSNDEVDAVVRRTLGTASFQGVLLGGESVSGGTLQEMGVAQGAKLSVVAAPGLVLKWTDCYNFNVRGEDDVRHSSEFSVAPGVDFQTLVNMENVSCAAVPVSKMMRIIDGAHESRRYDYQRQPNDYHYSKEHKENLVKLKEFFADSIVSSPADAEVSCRSWSHDYYGNGESMNKHKHEFIFDGHVIYVSVYDERSR